MHHSLDLSILDSGDSAFAIALARAGSDLAIARLPCEVVTRLQAFRDRLDRFVRSAAAPLSAKDLETYGRDLFDFAIRDDVRRLYERLPAANVRIHLLSDRPDRQLLLWEFLIEPGRPGVPRIDRSIVRVVPTVGVTPPPPRAFSAMTRVLFASADPADQGGVSWSHVKASLEGEFAAQVPEKFTVTAVDGTTKDLLSRALQKDQFDIFSFLRSWSGHRR